VRNSSVCSVVVSATTKVGVKLKKCATRCSEVRTHVGSSLSGAKIFATVVTKAGHSEVSKVLVEVVKVVVLVTQKVI